MLAGQHFRGGVRIAFDSGRGTRVTWRIQRSLENDDVVLALSGELDEEQAGELQVLLASEAGQRVVLDLSKVTFVGRAGVRVLAAAEQRGVVLTNCPSYVVNWIRAETRP